MSELFECLILNIMNIKEWRTSTNRSYKFKNMAVGYFNITKGYVIHHLRETEEQRAFNDAHYERWGFDFDGIMKYAVKMTIEEHNNYHRKGQTKETSEAVRKMSENRKGISGKKHTEEMNRRQSLRMMGRKPSKETIEKIRIANKGKKRSKEFCLRISEALTGKKQTSETVQKRLKSRIDYQHSEETKIKIGQSNKGKTTWMKGKNHTSESKQLLRNHFSSLIWVNNGVNNKRVKENEIPEGYVRGVMKHKNITK